VVRRRKLSHGRLPPVGGRVDGAEVERTGQPVAWYRRELLRRMLLGFSGALPVFIVSWVFRVKILQFLMLPALYALYDAFPLQSLQVLLNRSSIPELLVHPDWSHPTMFRNAALAGGLVLSAPWTAYQAFSYADRRAKPGGVGRIGFFVTASTAVVWGSAWLVPNLLVPALPQRVRFNDEGPWMSDPRGYAMHAISENFLLLHLVCDMLLMVCAAALVPIVVAFVISAPRARWGRLLRFGGLRVLLVSVGIATVLSPRGLPMIWWLCGLAIVYYASVAVAYLLVRGRMPESSQ
jgi:hypothetical protein